MGCVIIIPCPRAPTKTVFDEMVTIHGPNYPKSREPKDPGPRAPLPVRVAYQKALRVHHELIEVQKTNVVSRSEEPIFLCSSKKIENPMCACGHEAELLCDYPMGRGKTCDLPLCWCCSKHLNEEQDLCLIHFAEFVKKTGATQLNLWPPPRPNSR